MVFNIQNWPKPVLTSLAILTGLTAIYSGLWFVIGIQIKDSITDWATKQSAQGWIAEYQKIDIDGFPWRWRFKIKKPTLSRTNGNIQFYWSGPYIQLEMRPWNIKNIKFRTGGEHELAYAKSKLLSPIKLNLGVSQGELTLNKNRKLTDFFLVMEDTLAKVTSTQHYRFKQLNWHLSLNQPAAPKEKLHQFSTVDLQAELLGLTLPNDFKSALGRTINRIALSANFLGNARGNTLKQAFSSWASSGGSFDLKNFEIHWSKLVAKANGTFALDSALQPIAGLSGTITGYKLALNAMVDAGLIKPNLALVARFALRGMSGLFGAKKEDKITLSLAIQDGYLLVGPIKLIKLPKIIWN